MSRSSEMGLPWRAIWAFTFFLQTDRQLLKCRFSTQMQGRDNFQRCDREVVSSIKSQYSDKFSLDLASDFDGWPRLILLIIVDARTFLRLYTCALTTRRSIDIEMLTTECTIRCRNVCCIGLHVMDKIVVGNCLVHCPCTKETINEKTKIKTD